MTDREDQRADRRRSREVGLPPGLRDILVSHGGQIAGELAKDAASARVAKLSPAAASRVAAAASAASAAAAWLANEASPPEPEPEVVVIDVEAREVPVDPADE